MSKYKYITDSRLIQNNIFIFSQDLEIGLFNSSLTLNNLMGYETFMEMFLPACCFDLDFDEIRVKRLMDNFNPFDLFNSRVDEFINIMEDINSSN